MDENQSPQQDGQAPESAQTPEPNVYEPQPRIQSLDTDVLAPKKSRKKLIVAVLLILLIVGSVVAWLVLGGSEESNNEQQAGQSTETAQESAFSPAIFIENGKKLQYLNAQNEVTDYATLDTNDKFIEAYNDGEKVVASYVVSQPEPATNGGSRYTEYGQLNDGIKQKTVQLPDGVDMFTNPVLSPDKKSIVVEVGDEGDLMQNLSSVNVSDGSSQVIYQPETSTDGFKVVVGWLDNNTVLLQKQTCRQCDGPRLPILYSLNIVSKELKPFFNEDNSLDSIEYAGFYFSADNTRLFMFGGDYDKAFYSEPNTTGYTPTKLFEVDLKTAEPREIAQFTSTLDSFVGVSQDGTNVFISTADWVATESPNPQYQSEEGSYNMDTPKLNRVVSQSGSVSVVPIESRFITQGTRYGNVISSNDALTITVVNQPDQTKEDYALLRLISGEDNNLTTLLENSFEAGTGAINIFQLVD